MLATLSKSPNEIHFKLSKPVTDDGAELTAQTSRGPICVRVYSIDEWQRVSADTLGKMPSRAKYVLFDHGPNEFDVVLGVKRVCNRRIDRLMRLLSKKLGENARMH